jgi:hypothetical protein
MAKKLRSLSTSGKVVYPDNALNSPNLNALTLSFLQWEICRSAACNVLRMHFDQKIHRQWQHSLQTFVFAVADTLLFPVLGSSCTREA